MSIIEDVPEELRFAEKKAVFLEYLKLLPVPVHTKKYLLLDWCEYTGVKMTAELARKVGIPLQI